MQIRTTQQLRDAGHSTRAIGNLVDAGSLVRVTRGRYADAFGTDEAEHHLTRILAVAPSLPLDAVLSHESAAVLHGLPLPFGPIGHVRTIRTKRPDGGGQCTPNVRCLRTGMPSGHWTTMIVGGTLLRVTTPARTVAELTLRSLPWGVVAGDVALARGLTSEPELAAVAAELGRRKGIARARELSGRLDARSESVAESLSRVYLTDAGVPPPELQLWIGNDHRRVARLDFAWTKYRVAGECDGLGKYQTLASGSPAAALRSEKLRESEVSDLGWATVRWTFGEIFNGKMANRVKRVLLRHGWNGRPDG